MADLISRRHGLRTPRDHAANYYRRRNRKTRLDPTHNMFRTHSFRSGADIDVEAAFPGLAKRRPVTFAWKFVRGGAAFGTMWEMGGPDSIFCTVNETIVTFGLGNRSVPLAGVSLSVGQVLEDNVVYKFVLAYDPSTGAVNLFRDGKLVGSVLYASTFAAWSDGGFGRVDGISSDNIMGVRSPLGERVNMNNGIVVGPLDVYLGQVPDVLQRAESPNNVETPAGSQDFVRNFVPGEIGL